MIKDELGNRRFYGIYRGIVVDNNDPESLGRLRVQIPQILGSTTTSWAWGVATPGNSFTVPNVGDGIFVQFEGGDPAYPIWTGVTDLNPAITSNLIINVKDYGAKGNGKIDDWQAITDAITASTPGSIIYFPAGTYCVSKAINLLGGRTYRGTHSSYWEYDVTSKSVIKSLYHSVDDSNGAKVLYIDGRTTKNSDVNVLSDGGRIENLGIVGNSNTTVSGNPIDGIVFEGWCRDWRIQNVDVSEMSGRAIVTLPYNCPDGLGFPKGHNWFNVSANSAGTLALPAVTFYLKGITDSTFLNMLAAGGTDDGFYIYGSGGNKYVNCRAEFNSGNGFYIVGTVGGPIQFNGCSTDHNLKNGVYIKSRISDYSETIGAIEFNGLYLGRDGSADTAYSAITIEGTSGTTSLYSDSSGTNWNAPNQTVPITITGLDIFVATKDGHSGVYSPNYGLTMSYSTRVCITGGNLWGLTNAVQDLGNNADVEILGVSFFKGSPQARTLDTSYSSILTGTHQLKLNSDVKGLQVIGSQYQGNNLLEWRSTSGILGAVSASGRLTLGVANYSSRLNVTPVTSTETGIVVQSASSFQSGNLQEWRNSDGIAVASVAPSGTLTANGTTIPANSNLVTLESIAPITYVPTWSGTGLTFTGTPATGTYTKIGNLIFFSIKVLFTNVTNFGTGQYKLTLPIAPDGDYIFRNGGIHVGTTHYNMAADAAAGTTTVNLYHMQSTNGSNSYVYDDPLTGSNPITLTTSGYMYVSGVYLTA